MSGQVGSCILASDVQPTEQERQGTGEEETGLVLSEQMLQHQEFGLGQRALASSDQAFAGLQRSSAAVQQAISSHVHRFGQNGIGQALRQGLFADLDPSDKVNCL